ncbi:TetR/AcrR family transcriptional regulator [Streptomyces sp. NPDC058382]|uniref:TetR/AcrR family transcriptional regulator n=1 Tax=unclassified Streptomyces TaxID=2593676 RepID=UPI003634C840
MAPVPPDTGRADARRNRAKVLGAAVGAFTVQGLDVSLSEIAWQAGVGTGTVYRHFPSKENLLEAVLVHHVEDLVAAARRWSAQASPTAAFFGFLLETVDKSAGRRHVCDLVTNDTSWPRPMLLASARQFHEALAELLRAAQQAGGVRAGIGSDDVAVLIAGCATIRATHRDSAGGVRMVHLALEGLRGPASVTERHAFRYGPGERHVMRTRCEECGAEFEAKTAGRPARFCGATCRQRAHRRRSGR